MSLYREDLPTGEWIEVLTTDNIPIISMHTEGNYSFTLLRKFKHLIKDIDEAYSYLPYPYLVDFYSKHFIVTLINEDKKVYLIKKKGKIWE